MTDELPITLNFSGKKPPPSLKLNTNPDFFSKEQLISYGENADGYIVTNKRFVIEDTGTLSVIVTLKSKRRRFRRFDLFVARHDELLMVLAAMYWLIILLPFIAFFSFLAMAPEVKLAYAGYAIAKAPWVLFIGVWFGLIILSRSDWLESRIGEALSIAFGYGSILPAIIMAFIWSGLFVPQLPKIWPKDYIDIAESFWKNASYMVAVSAAYAPVIFLITKLLKLDFIDTIASAVLERKNPG